MDIKAYISSGVIESYVLGIADEQDVAELERLRLVHPEIAGAVEACEKWLSDLGRANSVPVAGDVRERLALTLKDEFQAPPVKGEFKPSSRGGAYTWLTAACLILLIASTGLNAYFYNRYKKALQDTITLREQRDGVIANNKIFETRLAMEDSNLRVMSAPGVLKISLPGIAGRENNLATVYWDTHTREVYLVANHLPVTPEGKQYQLWALVNGKPVDAGVLENCEDLCRLKTVQQAQAFAITLEKAGGSASPTLNQMVVLGNVKS